MRSVSLRLAIVLGLAACAAAPSSSGDGGSDTDGPPTGVARITGRVWVPAMAPGQVPPGEELPVAGAVVYLSSERPPPIPAGVFCERCMVAPGNAAVSTHDGAFALDAPPGNYWLVIQKAQFRYEQTLRLEPGAQALAAAQTTLPSSHDPTHGFWIPRIAVAAGTDDHIEEILGKIGLGVLDVDHRYLATEGDLDVYDNGHPTVETRGSVLDLIGDLEVLRRYHLVFLPCSDEMVPMLADPRIQANLRRYVMEGGKLYATDFAGKFVDTIFPPQLTLGDVNADTVGTYDPADPTAGTITAVGTARGGNYSSLAEIVDPDLRGWLAPQRGPTPGSPATQAYDPSRVEIADSWNWIRALTSVRLGVDADGNEVLDTPKPWVIGAPGFGGLVKYPMTVTYQPTGCGRVLYSTYHTTGGPHRGLYPQERILLYLILELGVCQSGPLVD